MIEDELDPVQDWPVLARRRVIVELGTLRAECGALRTALEKAHGELRVLRTAATE